ncbi:hypothetical protein PI95_034225 [Hassallia byssoidea VB512170]|uniref:Uncharacterized protein n=1 Tax=Hassallia byssoidea VB512170 TaxID=1304833 RepID=A0A846HMF7_9CYAN|nr:hypothetical protein [Hassalia byssoidea]NEU77394.1 hypothetical protein [Hassalia byssoidea VB512170]
MAAAITSTATTLEGQLWEAALRVQFAELSMPAETRLNNIQVNTDTENQVLSIVFSAPASFTLSSDGALVAAPTPYLP